MRREKVIALLEKNMPSLHAFGVKSLAIFGSTARQEATSASDIDILVSFLTSPSYDQYIETKLFLEDLFMCKVDLVIQDDLKSLVRVEVEREAIYVS